MFERLRKGIFTDLSNNKEKNQLTVNSRVAYLYKTLKLATLVTRQSDNIGGVLIHETYKHYSKLKILKEGYVSQLNA